MKLEGNLKRPLARLRSANALTNACAEIPSLCPNTPDARQGIVDRVAEALKADGYDAIAQTFLEESNVEAPLDKVLLQAQQYVRFQLFDLYDPAIPLDALAVDQESVSRASKQFCLQDDTFEILLSGQSQILQYLGLNVAPWNGSRDHVYKFLGGLDFGCLLYNAEMRDLAVHSTPTKLSAAIMWCMSIFHHTFPGRDASLLSAISVRPILSNAAPASSTLGFLGLCPTENPGCWRPHNTLRLEYQAIRDRRPKGRFFQLNVD